MKYKGFFVKITPDKNLSREDKNGKIAACDGSTVEVFSAAVDFDLLKNSFEDTVQLAKDNIV